MRNQLQQEVSETIAEVMDAPIADVVGGREISNWDSLRHLHLALALEQRFGIELEPEEVDQMRDLQSVIDVVARKRENG